MASVPKRIPIPILRALARGEKEIEAGVGFDIDAVFAEADKLLEEKQPESTNSDHVT